MTRRPRWPVLVVIVGVLAAVAMAALWLLDRDEPVDAPEQPAAAVEEPQAPGQADGEAAEPPEAAPEIVYGEEARANWDVTGVAAADELNVRTGPGVHNAITAALAADAAELESTGRIARVDGTLWREIVVPGDGTGWVNARYLTETRPSALADIRHAV